MTTRRVAGACAVMMFVALAWWLMGRSEPASSGGIAEAPAVTPSAGPVTSPVAAPWSRRSQFAMQAPRAVLTGRVHDEDDRPIASATVCARLDSDLLSVSQTAEPRCTTSERDGHYRLDGLYPVMVRLSAGSREHRPTTWQSPQGDPRLRLQAGQERTVDLMLRSGGVPIRGVVVDVAGGVIEGAWVSLGLTRMHPSHPVGVVTMTNVDGTFTLWAAPGAVTVFAQASGYVRGESRGLAPGMTHEVRLIPESVLVGRVIDAQTGEPLSDVRVTLGPRGYSRHSGRYESGVLTDADGGFRWEGLSPGIYMPRVQTAEMYGRTDYQVHLGFAEESEVVVIEAHPATSVVGEVLVAEADGERPCPIGTVTLEDRAIDESRMGPLDGEGHVTLGGLLPGTWSVTVECKGYVPAPEYPPVEVGTSPRTDLRWMVSPGSSISGQVVDGAGEPVPDAIVVASPRDTKAGAQRTSATATTTDTGRFSLEGLLAGTYTLNVHSQDHPQGEPREVVLERSVDDVRVVVGEGGRLRGTVVNAHAQPVVGVHIKLEGPSKVPYDSVLDDGSFERGGLRPGTYRVLAEQQWGEPLPSLEPDQVPGVTAEITAGEITEVRLVVDHEIGSISGVVRFDGEPVADAFVGAKRQSDRPGKTDPFFSGTSSLLTDEDGRFTIEGLRVGRYQVTAARRGGAEEVVRSDVRTGEEVTLELVSNASAAGRVVLAEGPAPERLTVRALRAGVLGGAQTQSLFRTGGAFMFDSLRPGAWTLEASAAEGVARLELELAHGEQRTELELRLEARATIAGQVQAVDTDEPIAGARITVGTARGSMTSFGNGPSGDHVTDEQGGFEVAQVPPGRIGIHVFVGRDQPYLSATTYAEVAPGGHLTVPPILLAPRVLDDDAPGDLGFTIADLEGEQEPEATPIVVATVRLDGPAAAAGLTAGDRIVAVSGHDVTGNNRHLFAGLTRVAPGAEVSLRLTRGEELQLVATR